MTVMVNQQEKLNGKVSSSKNKFIWVGGGVALVVIGVASFSYFKKDTSRTELATKWVKVSKGNLDVTILSTGVVQPENRLGIKPPISGRVEQVLTQEGNRVKKGQILAWMSSTERAALIDAARAKGPEELKKWEDVYKPTPILAPLSGMIILRNVEPGQTFATGDAVFVLSDRLTVKAQVDETDLSQIKLGQPATVVLDAYAKEKIQAKVDQIAFDAKTVNNVTTYIVDVLPVETPQTMRSGMTANVTFHVASKQDALMIPAEAVKVSEGRFVVMKGSSAKPEQLEKVFIEVGLNDGKRMEVLSGLSEGDEIQVVQLKSPGQKGGPGANNPFSPMGGGSRGGSGRGH